MDDFWQSFQSWFKEKTNSPLYLTFVGFYIGWNWRIFYVLFFEEASLLSQPRIEYALKFRFYDNWFLNILVSFLPPILFTYTAVTYLPRIHRWAHSVYLKYYFARKEAYEIANLDYEKRQTRRLEQEALHKERQKEQKAKIERTKTQEETREEEFNKFISNFKNREAIRIANRIVYEKNGLFSTQPDAISRGYIYIQPDFLSRLDASGLIKVNQGSRMEFTEKGKFFVKLLQD